MAGYVCRHADIQLNRPFEHEDYLRELCMKQQEINRLLDLDKGDIQAAANDNMPLPEPEADTLVERLTAKRTELRQVKDFRRRRLIKTPPESSHLLL